MAREAGKRYREIHFDICYCSPLIRAKETAELVLEGRTVPIVTDDRLMEMCFGEYEGIEIALHCRTAQSIWHFRHRSVLWRIRVRKALKNCLPVQAIFLKGCKAAACTGKGYSDSRTRCNEFKHCLSGKETAAYAVLVCRNRKL